MSVSGALERLWRKANLTFTGTGSRARLAVCGKGVARVSPRLVICFDYFIMGKRTRYPIGNGTSLKVQCIFRGLAMYILSLFSARQDVEVKYAFL